MKRVVVNLEDNRVVVGARKDMSYCETAELLGEGLVAAVSSAGMDSDVRLRNASIRWIISVKLRC